MCRAFASALFFKNHREMRTEEPVAFSDLHKERAASLIKNALEAGRKYLPEEESVKILESYGLPTLPSGLVSSKQEAESMAERIGFPVVMKVVSDDIMHKFDVKGVVLDIQTRALAGDAYDSIISNIAKVKPEARIKGIYVQKMVTKGEEVILGVKRDPSFGAVIMFGLGGLFVEVFKDVSFRVAPVGPRSASEMIQEIKAYDMLAGARGKKPRDIRSVEECIQRLSRLALDLPEIKELDINPLIVNDEGAGCYVADARIML
jgi:acyl-CoA synthetase (NDP forming)